MSMNLSNVQPGMTLVRTADGVPVLVYQTQAGGFSYVLTSQLPLPGPRIMDAFAQQAVATNGQVAFTIPS